MKAEAAVLLLTTYLVIYTALFQLQVSPILLGFMFLLSPVLLLLMVYLVLKDNTRPYPGLKDGDEWGYRDKEKTDLKIF